MKKIISIVAPMYNEESLVHQYCKETKEIIATLEHKYEFEILLINDGSKDNTYKIMMEEQEQSPELITTICLSRNFGLEGAVNAGIRKAIGDAVIVMDADLQDPLILIPIMIEKWEKGADIVVGSRIKRSNDNFFKRLGADFYYKILNSLSGKLKLEKSAANFRLLSRRALDQILSLPEVNSVFRITVPFIGMKTDIVKYDRDKRFSGKTKYNLKSMIPYALDSITGISIQPLRKILYILPIIVLFSIISVIGAVITTELWKIFWISMLVVSIISELIFIVLAIMAEYIAQIMIEVKGRPISIIYEYNPSRSAKVKMCKEEKR